MEQASASGRSVSFLKSLLILLLLALHDLKMDFFRRLPARIINDLDRAAGSEAFVIEFRFAAAGR